MSNATFQYNDGGRLAAGFKGAAGDCVCRAIAIASGRDYTTVYSELSRGAGSQRHAKRSGKPKASAGDGITTGRKWFKDYMRSLGFRWNPTMGIGTGCRVHLNANELPAGRLVVMVSRHAVAVIDGVIHDLYDPSRAGTRCVYGYWSAE